MGFAVYLRQAVENGEVIFPGNPKVYGFCKTCDEHKYGDKLKCLQCLRGSKSAHSYSAQYFNDPVDAGAVEFKTPWLRRFDYTDELVKALMQVKGVLSIDPAVSLRDASDYTGIVVTKTLPNRQIYILEAIQKKVSPQELIEEVFKLQSVYNIGKLLLETASAQILFLDLFKQEMRKRNKFFVIDEVKGNNKETKAMRIRGLIPYYANGMIVHKNGLNDLEDQLLQFPRNTHDDIIDALSQQVPYWKSSPQPVDVVDSSPYGSLNWWKKQNKSPQDRITNLFKDFINRG